MFKYLLKKETTSLFRIKPLVFKNFVSFTKGFKQEQMKEVNKDLKKEMEKEERKGSGFRDQKYNEMRKNKIETYSKKKIELESSLREEDKDNMAASKLETLEEQIMAEENAGLGIEQINSEMSVFKSKEKEQEEIKGTPIEVLKNKFNINTDAFQDNQIKLYREVSYAKEISPRIELLRKAGFSEFHIKVILTKSHTFLLNQLNIDKLIQSKEVLKKLLTNFSDFEICDTVACIPNIIDISASKIESNLHNIKSFLRLDDPTEYKTLLLDYPILISNLCSDPTKIEFYFKLYLDMSKEEMCSFAKKFPLILISTPDNVLNVFKTVDRMKFDRKEWRGIIEKNPKVFLFRHTQITNVVSLLTKQGLKAKEVFDFIKQYPDLLLGNRHELLRHKLALFEDLKLNKETIKNLIKRYPFILLKSYNSFIYKVFYFSKELKRDIEDTEIYPVIYAYNLNRDIKPRCELMRKNNKWIPLNEAFSMTLEDLAAKLNVKLDTFVTEEVSSLHERDLLFRYSKYLTI